MAKKYRIILSLLLSIAILIAGAIFLSTADLEILNPKGEIALKQKELMITATLLMSIIVIPVLLLTIYIPWKYRETNKEAEYRPDWDYNFFAEALWWGLPCLIIIALSIITWKSSHELDPFKPLQSDKKPLRIQVVALQWKWLFIYPEEKIATINYVQFPEKRPIAFEITADAPMNAFWIPKLGGQIYAMPAMVTKLHLIANEQGIYRGTSASLSGVGFSGMKFNAKATSQEEFDTWARAIQLASPPLDLSEYEELVEPSENHPVTAYQLQQEDLFEQIVMNYMLPMPKKTATE